MHARTLISRTPQRLRQDRAFTLIEVLVVVSIVVLLVSLLVPSLSRARDQAKLVTCKSNLHQIGIAVSNYAHPAGLIPFGPKVGGIPPYLEDNDGSKATNQIWTGPQAPSMNHMALGLLMNRSLAFPDLLYCPADDSHDPIEELAKVRGRRPEPGFCSYMYRQLDETDGRGRIDNLGCNGVGRRAVALALDTNFINELDGSSTRTNHRNRRVNILYHDASVISVDNEKSPLTIIMNAAAMSDPEFLVKRRDEILQAADASYSGRRP
ncbi:MAG TPA: prepilin-type N-terminal cleavage/methylation domain-containing protein [Phycisphaerae bacterium]|nr:prepilin-type N-terminal cleavage/methylation domain-containing protein [Phycisphaerae bacterium]